MIGKTISHYKILEHIGGGGMGIVYKAQDLKLDRFVALKFLPPAFATDPTTKERFIHEAQSASALDHTNICNIFEISETEDGQLFISMAYYEGETLQNKIKDERLKIKEAIDYAIQIAQGLKEAHDRGIVHRDIKPANIIITEKGEAKILDFGLAKFRGQTRITKTGSTLGTVAYMSPEQARGEAVDHRTDIWSLGVMSYEMLTGELPFKGDYDQAIVYSILNEEPEAYDDIPPELREIIKTALAKNPAERYQDIGELNSDLQVVRSGSDSSQKMIGKRPKAKGKRRRRLRNLFIYSVILFAVLLTGYFMLQSLTGKEIVPIPIAVFNFENLTGDPTFDYLQYTIPNLLIEDLTQSRFFQPNPWYRNKDLLKQIGKKDLEFISVEVSSQICQMDQVPIFILGSFYRTGDMFRIDARIYDSHTKKIIHHAKSQGEGATSIIKSQMDDLSEQIAVELEIPEKEFAESKKPLIDVTTSNLEAYKCYLLGYENAASLYYKEAKHNYIKAIQLDSTFAMAHLALASTYAMEDSTIQRDIHLEWAMKYRNRISPKERFYFDFYYDLLKGSKDLSNRVSELKKATLMYPKEEEIFNLLGNYYAGRGGSTDSAALYYQKVLNLNPDHKLTLNSMGFLYAEKKEYTRALEYLRRYAKVAPNEANPYDSMGQIYFELNNYEKSIDMYKMALNIKPDFKFSQIGIASNYIRMHDNRRAREYLNYCLKNVTFYIDQIDLQTCLATAYMAEGDIDNTIKEMQNIINLAQQHSDTIVILHNKYYLIEILYENGDLKEAGEKLAAVKKVLENSNFDDWYKTRLWGTYFSHLTRLSVKGGNIENAKEYVELFKKEAEQAEGPRRIKWYFTLSGLIANAEGNNEKAIADLEQADLDDPFNNYHLALTYLNNTDEIKAIEQLENAVNYVGFPDLRNEMYRNRAEKQLALLKVGE